MPNESVSKFYLEEHKRQFKKWTVPYSQADKYKRQDALARQRDTPAGSFQSPEHYLLAIAGGPSGNLNRLAHRRAIAHGLTEQGFNHEQIMRALTATSAEVDELLHAPPLAAPHMHSELAYDKGEPTPGPADSLNRSPYPDGFRTAIPSRPQGRRS